MWGTGMIPPKAYTTFNKKRPLLKNRDAGGKKRGLSPIYDVWNYGYLVSDFFLPVIESTR